VPGDDRDSAGRPRPVDPASAVTRADAALGVRSGPRWGRAVSRSHQEESQGVGGRPLPDSPEGRGAGQDRSPGCRTIGAATALGGSHAGVRPGSGGRSAPGSGAGARGWPQGREGRQGTTQSLSAPRQAMRDAGRANWGPAPLRGLAQVGCAPPAPQLVVQDYGRAVAAHQAR